MPIIRYRASNFTPHYPPALFGTHNLSVSWQELVWAAITVGKPGLAYLLSHGMHSVSDIIVRSHSVYANLRQNYSYIEKSSLYERLDPTEKGATSYFMGMMAAKIICARLLDTPYVFHLSMLKSLGGTAVLHTKSQPDLIGCSRKGNWIVAEAKGRTGSLNDDAMKKAKLQTRQLRKINGIFPSLRVAIQAYFSPELSFEVSDPDEYDEEAADIDFDLKVAIRDYYSYVLSSSQSSRSETKVFDREYLFRDVDEVGISVGIDSAILKSLEAGNESFLSLGTNFRPQFEERIGADTVELLELKREEGESIVFFPDGLAISLDQRWSSDKMRMEPQQRQAT